jgi:hypothetical protein
MILCDVCTYACEHVTDRLDPQLHFKMSCLLVGQYACMHGRMQTSVRIFPYHVAQKFQTNYCSLAISYYENIYFSVP